MYSTGTPADNTRLERLPQAVYKVARRHDTAGLAILDGGVVVGAWVVAYLAGLEFDIPAGTVDGIALFVGLALVTQLIANRVVGLYGPVWRYASIEEAVRVVAAVGLGTVVATIELVIIGGVTDTPTPLLSAPPIAALLMLLGCGGIRFQARLFALERRRVGKSRDGIRTVIIGAGSPGANLAQELNRSDADVELVGIVPADELVRGRSVRGVKVLGNLADLHDICRAHRIERILIALPDAGRERMQEIVGEAMQTDAQLKVLPRTSEMIRGPLLRSLRDLDLADLLGREHAPVDADEIAGFLEGTTVLVTGAGGSIGSEVARQVARYRPAKLLLLDRDESLLAETLMGPLAHAEPLLADIRDRSRLREIFAQHRPDVVFHAAAHKHVPILERHPVEAVHTNLLGTRWLAANAAEYGCTRFVHISTDKAANPCSMMGASKRAAELVVFDVGNEHQLPFAAVRFGNVLGSRGSVVPTFLRQILEGGPVTVTDPEMTRYFMTIPEAVSLVLQAAAMADGGEIFLLDMGKPVSIIDLARQMIRLAGLRPDEDIPIEITGVRPGERLHERLYDDAETVDPTSHPSIMSLRPRVIGRQDDMSASLRLLEVTCNDADDAGTTTALRQLLRDNGIECELPPPLRGSRGASRKGDEGKRRRDDVKRPVLLGGAPSFEPALPFARPTRPPLDRVWKRLEPSYERGMLTNGSLVAELEERAADRLQVAHVVAVSSCTSGLILTVQAVTDGRPGPVVVPSFTFSASGHSVVWNGRTPRFVECRPATFQIDREHAARHLDGAAALMATHVFGAPCGPEHVEALGRAAGIPVLFDAAHAFGAFAGDRPVGGFGVAEVFSLTPTKVLVAGEGGLVATNDEGLAEVLRIGREYGNPGDYNTRFVGLNARMSEVHAAMALESLEILDDSLRRRRDLANDYRKLLDGIPGIELQVLVSDDDESTYKDFTVAVDFDRFGLTRDELVAVLASEGIETRNYFDPPLHRQLAYERFIPSELPVTEAVSRSVVSLPIYTALDREHIERVADVILAAHVHADALQRRISAQRDSNHSTVRRNPSVHVTPGS